MEDELGGIQISLVNDHASSPYTDIMSLASDRLSRNGP